MLMNNLDPEVAEHPDDLIVYGGIGQGGAQLGVLRRDRRARCATLEDDETLLVQSGKPVGVFRTHDDAPARADREREPGAARGRPGTSFRELERAGPDDVRPDDGGLVDLHRHPGDPAGHLRDLRRAGARSTSAARSRGGWSSPPGSAAWAARSRSPSR